MELVPAIIPKSLEDIETHLSKIRGLVPSVQIDITDGKFVPEACFPFLTKEQWCEFEELTSGDTKLPFANEFDFEADLMIRAPEKYVEQFVLAGFSRLVVHFESTNELPEVFDILEGRVEIGLGVAISTPEDEWDEAVSKVDFVQFMGIGEIGFQGEPFDERVIPKIATFKSKYPDVTISVDGGVRLGNAPQLLSAGVSRLVSGSAVFGADDPKKAIQGFQKLSKKK